MPYSCRVSDGIVKLESSRPIAYPLKGQREERSLQGCWPGRDAGACTPLMLHRFAISCGGETVAWARVARAASALGIELPQGLPDGFAPIAQLQGRIVLPPQARFQQHHDTVASEPLAVESVAYRAGDDQEAAAADWKTVVKAEMHLEASGAAARIAGIVAVFLASFLGLGLWTARRPLPHGAVGAAATFARRVYHAFEHLGPKHEAAPADSAMRALLNGLSIANARLAEAELLVGSLPPVLSMRGVLQGELHAVRVRLDGIAKTAGKEPAQKSGALLRGVTRDLERIARMANGAVKDTAAGSATPQTNDNMPDSIEDAYRILGLNGDASAAVAKKLVDALRMTWHPDFARNDEDRRLREARMKQINAAWDMIKPDRADAA